MKLFKSKWLTVAAIAIVGWLGFSFTKIKLHENIVNKEMGDLEGKITGLERNNNALERFIQQIANPSFLEKEARLKLNYKKPDEEVAFVYTDDTYQRDMVSADFNRQLALMPNYLKWFYYLLGY